MLATFLSIYQGFFSRGFWLGNFLPVVVFAAIHLTLAAVVFPGQVTLVAWLTAEATSNPAKMISVVLAALVILAWILGPLVPMFRGLLDGSLLPAWLLEKLRQERLEDARVGLAAAAPDLQSLKAVADQWDQFATTTRQTLIEARDAGLGRPAPADDSLANAAAAAVGAFTTAVAGGAVPPLAVARNAAGVLAGALRAGFDFGPSDEQTARKARLQGYWAKLLAAVQQTRKQAQLRLDDAALRIQDTPLDYYRASRVGDVRERTQSYSQRAYGVDFDFLWPRLQLSFSKEDPLVQRLGDAQSQVDFAVLSMALAVTIPLVWLPLLAIASNLPWFFIGVGIASPLLIGFFNELTIQNQVAFGTIVEAAIDKYRLEVLTGLLRQPMPASRAAERASWAAVRVANDTANSNRLSYWAVAG